MSTVQVTIHLPDTLWRAVQALAPQEGDTNTVILRALEEYVTSTHKRRGRQRSGKYQRLVKALSTPVADLHLSARPASALQMLNIRYAYELVQKSPTDLFQLPNFGNKSLKEIKEKLAALGLTLGMTLDDESYRAAVVATVAANIAAAKGGADE
jgi:Bacterial RNA polymerase, alpha chain C terminal domain